MIDFFILHASSAVGKTYMMSRFVSEHPAASGIEMDDCRYWDSPEPEFSGANLAEIVDCLGDEDAAAFMAIYAASSAKMRCCIAYLVGQIGSLRRQAEGADSADRVVVVTCGVLPRPPAPDEPSIYRWLQERLPGGVHHVLIEISEEDHLRQMGKRDRLHLKDEIIDNYRARLTIRDRHDIAVSSYDQLAAYIRRVTPVFATQGTNGYPMPKTPRIIAKSDRPLKYVQIFGERNSGTNHLRQLVSVDMIEPDNALGSYATKRNPVNKARMIGYKHYYARRDRVAAHQHETLFLVLYKNPYTWIRSTLAKPYHFRECLSGKRIEDLPGTLLAGYDVHGKLIPDVHPETGQLVSIFDLRRHKIANWEALRDQADSIAFLNYESLLMFPTETVQSLIDSFGSLFKSGTATVHTPDPDYVRKYATPEPFTESEMRVMNAHIDWATENSIGYVKDNLFIPD